MAPLSKLTPNLIKAVNELIALKQSQVESWVIEVPLFVHQFVKHIKQHIDQTTLKHRPTLDHASYDKFLYQWVHRAQSLGD